MFGRSTFGRDPYEGGSAYGRQMRVRIEGLIAIALAILACGLSGSADRAIRRR